MKAATIYEREGMLYVHSSSKTTVGLWILNAPVLSIDKTDVGEVGRAIRECLAASCENVPHPRSFTNLFDPVLVRAGVKSFGRFLKAAKCVEVETSCEATVRLIPTRNEGVKSGFVPLTGKTVSVIGSDEDLGSAAIEALATSE
ncbi:hypothetical protein [Sinorhizobium sp. GL28]|uniref:hypothetical protein n=1 Tax=Sinorhizobium sp. GL28 TaxID=1358418 RepID=UPI0012E3DF90|nr:hypothetical protein [Sinorhizobium sp. GL28]